MLRVTAAVLALLAAPASAAAAGQAPWPSMRHDPGTRFSPARKQRWMKTL